MKLPRGSPPAHQSAITIAIRVYPGAVFTRGSIPLKKIVQFKRRARNKGKGAVFPLALILVLLVAIGVVAYSKYLPTPHPAASPIILSSSGGSQTLSGPASVIDGDTIEIHGTRIRLFGIDAPESDQLCTVVGKAVRCGQQATFALSNKIEGQVVECHPKDQDQYGRVVAVCLVGGEDINAWMVAQGWALAYRHYSTDYVSQEQSASQSKAGIWQGEFEPPWDWRHNRPQRPSSRSEIKASSPWQPAVPRGAFYYPPGGFEGTRYRTIAECSQARERAGNVGVCVVR